MHTMIEVNQPVRLRGQFINAAGDLADPSAITLTVTSPSGGATSSLIGALTHESTGIYYLDVTPNAAGVWTYTFAASGNNVDDTQTDYFLVGRSADFGGPCDPWITPQDVFSCRAASDIAANDRDYGQAAEVAAVASTLLYQLSGQRYPGICVETVRPCRRRSSWPAWWTWERGWGVCSCGLDRCGCGSLQEVPLGGGRALLGIQSVYVDGEVVPASSYRIDDDAWLVRTDGEPWPSCQDLTRDPLTETETFQVTFFAGQPVPPPGVLAAKRLAGELYLACSGGTGCVLPRRVQTRARQGLTEVFGDIAGLLDKGLLGLEEIDVFLTADRWAQSHGPTVIVSPDFGPVSRRVGTG